MKKAKLNSKKRCLNCDGYGRIWKGGKWHVCGCKKSAKSGKLSDKEKALSALLAIRWIQRDRKGA